LGKSKLSINDGEIFIGMPLDFMLAAAAAALLNIGLLGGIITTYIQNMRLIKSYFTIGLVLIASLFIVQNIVIVIFWSKLYIAWTCDKEYN